VKEKTVNKTSVYPPHGEHNSAPCTEGLLEQQLYDARSIQAHGN